MPKQGREGRIGGSAHGDPHPGKTWPAEITMKKDPVSGAAVRQLTGYKAHSSHNYFTHPGWYDDGRKLIIRSDRENRSNLFGVNLDSGELTQLTDWSPAEPGGNFCKNPVREEIYYKLQNQLLALDLRTLETRPLFNYPDRYRCGGANVTADGRHIITGAGEDMSHRFQVDLGHGYIGFHEMHAARPHSLIWKVPIDGATAETVLEDRCWLTHFNTSPKLPNIMTFCHEGPWDRVDNRIWGLDLDTGRTWKIRPTAPGETVGHEYWMSDGEHIGYHGAIRHKSGIFGSIRYDNTDHIEAPFDGHCWHFHSHKLDLVVGDGSAGEPYLLAWRFRGDVFEGPKVLARHRGSFHTQQLHVHPLVHAGGAKVLYTADPQGYGQVFIVDVPEWDDMPERAAVMKNKEV